MSSKPARRRVLDGLTVCPACRLNKAQLVDEDCVVCNGHGTVRLGLAALSIYDADVVAMTVHLVFYRTDAGNMVQAFNDLDIAGVTRRLPRLEPVSEPVVKHTPRRKSPEPARVYRQEAFDL